MLGLTGFGGLRRRWRVVVAFQLLGDLEDSWLRRGQARI